jgi:hypothetical protein
MDKHHKGSVDEEDKVEHVLGFAMTRTCTLI